MAVGGFRPPPPGLYRVKFIVFVSHYSGNKEVIQDNNNVRYIHEICLKTQIWIYADDGCFMMQPKPKIFGHK